MTSKIFESYITLKATFGAQNVFTRSTNLIFILKKKKELNLAFDTLITKACYQTHPLAARKTVMV